jgi:hypothetical protein
LKAARRSAWSLEAARALLPDVRRRTAEAVAEVDALVPQRDAAEENTPARAELEQRIQRAVSRWIRAMEALGVEVKGAWLVDFDNGRGCYCWRWPEERLDFFHGYDEGFEGRTRIQ